MSGVDDVSDASGKGTKQCPYCGEEIIPSVLVTNYITTWHPAKLWKEQTLTDVIADFDKTLNTETYDSDINDEYECPACSHPLTQDQALAMLEEDPEWLRRATDNAL